MSKQLPSIATALSIAQLAKHLEQSLSTLPLHQQSEQAWSELSASASAAGDYELMKRCAIARHTLKLADPARAAHRAWDQAVLALRLGQAAQQAQDQPAVQQSLTAALAALSTPDPEQDLGFEDWLTLGEELIALDPSCFQAIAQSVQAQVQSLPLPIQRDAWVQLARLEAKSLYAQGQLDAALAKSTAGRFDLMQDQDDAFSADVLLWLLEAQRTAEAAKLAFESVFNERQYSAQQACHLAYQQVQQPDADIYWDLTLAAAALLASPQGFCALEDGLGIFQAYSQAAKRKQADHPALLMLEAHYQFHRLENVSQALRLYEQAAPQFEWLNSVVLFDIWRARIQVHGAKHALSLPMLPAPAAVWAYSTGLAVLELPDYFPQDSYATSEQIAGLAKQYYQVGLQLFEGFFATGQGQYESADIEVYAMLCESLEIEGRLSEV